jgi:hypothetical protein
VGARPQQADDGRHLDQPRWNHAMRGETELQATDRQFNELLRELRAAQTGVQILFAFLLGLAFAGLVPLLHRLRHERDR